MTDATDLNDALASNFMVVDLTLKSWTGNMTDREASSEVITQKGATKDSGKFVKYLFASADGELQAVHTSARVIRDYVKQETSPWQGSYRLLAAVKAITFLSKLSGFKQDYDSTVVALAGVWDARVQQAIANLGGLADAADYPSSAEVAAMFGMTIDLLPVPSEQDFSRINLPSAVITALGERHATMLEKQMQDVHTNLKENLLKEIQRMAKQLGKAGAGEKTRLYDSLVGNLQAQVAMLRTMNASGSPELNALADKIEQQLLATPVEAFRNSPAKAAEVAALAQNLAVEAAMESVWMI
jgi:hypothetical protein